MHRLAVWTFDRTMADRFTEWLGRIRDPEQAAEAGIWILEWVSGDELLSRLERALATFPHEDSTSAL